MSGMTSYFIRRLLLVPITFLAITLMVYTVLRNVPGGPIEQAEVQMKMAAMTGESGSSGSGSAQDDSSMQLDGEAMEELKRYYAMDKPIIIGYLQWLGAWPKEIRTRVPAVPVAENTEAVEKLETSQMEVKKAQTELQEWLAKKPITKAPSEPEPPKETIETPQKEDPAPVVPENQENKENVENKENKDNQTQPPPEPEPPKTEQIATYDGEWYRVANPKDIPEDTQKQVVLLQARSLDPELKSLNKYLNKMNLAHINGQIHSLIDNKEQLTFQSYFAEANKRRKALGDAKAKHSQLEEELGFTLNGKKIEQNAFAILRTLNQRKLTGEKKLNAHLAKKSLTVFQSQYYQEVNKYYANHLAPQKSEKATEEEQPEPLEEKQILAKLGATQEFIEKADELIIEGYNKRDVLVAHLQQKDLYWVGGKYYKKLSPKEIEPDAEYFETAEILVNANGYANQLLEDIKESDNFVINKAGLIYKIDERFSGILQLDFGRSYTRGEPVLQAITSKFEVSLWFGLIGYILSWVICVPLGVFKAIRHKTSFDSFTSILVFLGYAIPGFLLCLILLTYVAVNVEWIPLGGYKPDNIEEMSFFEGLIGRMKHMLIPVLGYLVGGFAAMTILMKNSLLDNLGQDYVRTAFAKGLSEKRVIFVHALRNSLIPITAGIGHALGLLFAGSFLIEKTCNIDGMGLLGYQAIVEKDYPIILGTLVFGVLIRLFGNILSDLVWSLIDPRIRFS